jgi:hypothetical protein
MKCKLPQPLEDTEKKGHIIVGMLNNWRRFAVLTTERGSGARMIIFEPAPSEVTAQTFEHWPFMVDGRFQISRKINNEAQALAEWKLFRAA